MVALTNKSRFERLEEKLKETPPKKWGKLGAGVALGGFAFGWLAFPYILDFAINMVRKFSCFFNKMQEL